MPLAVCATPIGNLEDVTLRVLRALAETEVILCEDTRRTRGLLERHGLRGRLVSHHEHNEAQRTDEALGWLRAGRRIALVTDAGLPAISDPGARLVSAALDEGLEVTVLPGASAVETALVASGLAGARYAFVGFLPRKRGELADLWREVAASPHPTVAFESPQRLPAALAALAEVAPARRVAVCRELTKLHEEVVRATAVELAERFATPPAGEITLVVGAGSAAPPEEPAARAAVAELVAEGVSRRRAARIVGRLTGVAPNRLYDAGL
jgi:16S rRNA (cytidine1402-2'-O)-methyltransferase